MAAGINMEPPVVERERVVGDIEKGLVSRIGLVHIDALVVVELLLSSSMVKLVFGEGERCFGENEGDPRDTKLEEVGDAME